MRLGNRLLSDKNYSTKFSKFTVASEILVGENLRTRLKVHEIMIKFRITLELP